jgi:Na+/H+-dicarboxylate symporter
LIVAAMILAVQRLKEMQKGGGVLARWTIIYYVGTTLLAIGHSTILVSFLWRRFFTEVTGSALENTESGQALIDDRSELKIHEAVVDMFDSFIPSNIVAAFSNNNLLGVLIMSIVLGYMIKGPDSPILRVTKEIERIITVIITFLIQLAPIGVFFLILSNLMRLDIAQIGANLGVLVGGAIATMSFHLFIVLPMLFYAIVRKNPYPYWFKSSKAWITAWGTASSAATLPLTMKCVIERGVPTTIAKFSVPLGCLVNMDGYV